MYVNRHTRDSPTTIDMFCLMKSRTLRLKQLPYLGDSACLLLLILNFSKLFSYLLSFPFHKVYHVYVWTKSSHIMRENSIIITNISPQVLNVDMLILKLHIHVTTIVANRSKKVCLTIKRVLIVNNLQINLNVDCYFFVFFIGFNIRFFSKYMSQTELSRMFISSY